MTLSDEARERLEDIVALQPTKNAELQDRWGLDSGSDVHQYLESELKEYYYRDENSLICATDDAATLVGAEAETEDGQRIVRLPPLQAAILDVIAGPDDDPQSVVAVLHALQDAGRDPEVEDVRSGLRSLSDKGLCERVQRTVPTFRMAVARDELAVEELD
ncbi:MAG: DUF5797 family protein [Halorientalis sp.]